MKKAEYQQWREIAESNGIELDDEVNWWRAFKRQAIKRLINSDSQSDDVLVEMYEERKVGNESLASDFVKGVFNTVKITIGAIVGAAPGLIVAAGAYYAGETGHLAEELSEQLATAGVLTGVSGALIGENKAQQSVMRDREVRDIQFKLEEMGKDPNRLYQSQVADRAKNNATGLGGLSPA